MKNSDKHIDALFKRLKDDTFTVSEPFLDDLNKRLDTHLPEKKAERRFGFWFLLSGIAGLLITSLVVAYSGLYTTNKTSHIQKNRLEIGENKEHSSAGTSNHTLSSEESVDDASLSGNSKRNTALPLTVADGVTDDASVKSNTVQKFSESATPRAEYGTNAVNSVESAAIKQQTVRKPSKSTAENVPLNGIGSANKEVPYEINSTIDSLTISLPVRDISLDFGPQGVYSFPMHKKQKVAADKTPKPWQYDIQVYGGISQAYWKMKPYNESALLKPDRVLIMSPTVGAKADVFYKNINASLGLEYYQSNQKFSEEVSSITQTGVDSMIVDYYMDSTFVDSVWYLDSVYIYQINPTYDTVAQKQLRTNTFTWLSIPVSFGYRFTVHHWSFIPRAGVCLNIGIARNLGTYPGYANTQPPTSAMKLNADIVVQTEIRRNFSKFHVFATPYYRGNLSPMLKAPSFSISHQSWGVNLGVGIDL